MKEFHRMTIASVTRDLPICKVNDKLYIAGFVIFGDVEMTKASAKELIKKIPEHDIMITAESKGIPLIYEMAAQMGSPTYLLARKSQKLYMRDTISIEVKSITTTNVQRLYLDTLEAEKIEGKRVLIIDDVISTGESIDALEKLVVKAGGTVVGKAAILAEGDAKNIPNLTYLEYLPLFTVDDNQNLIEI